MRLIEIESSTVPPSLRLVEFAKDFPAYITLSHRWGSPQPFKTTQASLSAHSMSIPFTRLPKTFTDAINVAQALAVKYIWIDSICIVQDSQDDWRRQSEQMGSIYQMSLCTLAAIDAHVDGDEDRGLFVDRDMLPFSVLLENTYKFQYNEALPDPNVPTNTTYKLNSNAIDVKKESASAWKSSQFTLKPNLTTFEMSVELSEWNCRAWIFQERMLSTRVLYFTKEQIFWECAEHTTSEHAEQITAERGSNSAEVVEGSDRLHTALRRIHNFQDEASSVADDARYGASFFDLWDEYQRFKVWWVLVERYSASQLTYNTDKWYAIAGLCSILQSHFQSTIHAGVWENAAGAGILWHARDEALRAYKGYHAPSWSWLGLEGAVKFTYKDESYTGYVQKVKPLYQNASFSTTDPEPDHGPGSFYGTLSLSCPSRRAGISSQRLSEFLFNESTGRHDQDPPAWKVFHDISHGKSQLELSKEFRSQNLPSRTQFLTGHDGRAIGWVVMDFDEQTASEVVCAAIALRILNNYRTSEQHIVECVVLINNPSEPHSYRRVGRGRIVEYGWLATCTTQLFQII
jgi:Heterokaryon incompatibility protein (HET)